MNIAASYEVIIEKHLNWNKTGNKSRKKPERERDRERYKKLQVKPLTCSDVPRNYKEISMSTLTKVVPLSLHGQTVPVPVPIPIPVAGVAKLRRRKIIAI